MGVKWTSIKSQHTKLTLEKKIFLPLLLGFDLAFFRSRVQRSNQQAKAQLWEFELNSLLNRTPEESEAEEKCEQTWGFRKEAQQHCSQSF